MASGWASLGRMLAGGGVDKNRIRAERFSMLADADRRIAEAGMKMDEQTQRLGLADSLIGAGYSPGEAMMIATASRAGFNPQQLTGARGDLQEQRFRGGAVDAGIDMYGPNNPNAYLMGVASGPQDLAKIQGDVLLGNVFAPGGEMQGPTAVGQGRLGLMGAQASQAQAGAQENLAQALLYEDKRLSPGRYMRPSAGGGRAVFQIAEPNGSVRSVVSPDGENYVDSRGNLVPLPVDAVPHTEGQGAAAMAEQRQADSVAPLAGALLGGADLSNLEEATRETSGVPQAWARFVSPAMQRVMPSWNADARESTVFMDNIAQELKQVLANNPRFPQWQEKLVSGLIPSAGAILDPEGEAAKARQVSGDLLRTIEDAQTRLRYATGKERVELAQDIDRMARIVKKIQEGPGAPRLKARAETAPVGISPDVDALLREEGL